MHREIERRYYTFDTEAVKSRIADAGGVRKGMFLFKTVTFVPPPGALYVRVRDEGHRTTMTVKRGERPYLFEDEVTVDSFDGACGIFLALGLVRNYYVEKLRDIYVIGDTEVVFDRYPGLPPIIEVESPTEGEMIQVADLLGLPDEEQVSSGHMYTKLYGVPKKRPIGDLSFDSAEAVFAKYISRNMDSFNEELSKQRSMLESMRVVSIAPY